MGKKYEALSDDMAAFIARQKMFFVGTATADSRVSVSPKGMDSLRVLGSNRVLWLNVTGSGNETAAHVQIAPRMTIMFCAFEGVPYILRLYGSARVIHKNDPDWDTLSALLPPLPGARQMFDMQIDLVQVSCGMSVPLYTYEADRELLNDWAQKRGAEGLNEYWQEKNQFSVDGIPTHLVSHNIAPAAGGAGSKGMDALLQTVSKRKDGVVSP